MKYTAFRSLAIVGAAGVLLVAGCKKTADNSMNYKTAINAYYAAHPACLWSSPQQFPTQLTTSDTTKTAPFDALVDQGLLQRTTAEKKVLIIATKQVTNYDLTSQGRSAWTVDTTNPGSGNFCYGNREVAAIDSSTPNNGQVGDTTQVAYHWKFSGAPSWAKAAVVQGAFPNVATNLAGNGTATAALVDTSSGWQLQPSTHPATGVSSADSSIAQ